MTLMIAASTTCPKKADAIAAVTRISTSGFMNTCRKSERREWCSAAAGSFGPNRDSRAAACSAVRPAASEGVGFVIPPV